MAKITINTNQRTSAAWMGDYANREHILPGGARLNAAQFTAGAFGMKTVESGTVVGRTYAERDAGTGFGPAADADDEIYIVAFDVSDAGRDADVDLYRPGGIVKETFLPGWAGLSAAIKAAIRAKYQTTVGVN